MLMIIRVGAILFTNADYVASESILAFEFDRVRPRDSLVAIKWNRRKTTTQMLTSPSSLEWVWRARFTSFIVSLLPGCFFARSRLWSVGRHQECVATIE